MIALKSKRNAAIDGVSSTTCCSCVGSKIQITRFPANLVPSQDVSFVFEILFRGLMGHGLVLSVEFPQVLRVAKATAREQPDIAA